LTPHGVARFPFSQFPLQVRRLLEHHAWPRWSRMVSESIGQACAQPLVDVGQGVQSSPLLVVILYCKSGRDRSVGLSVVLDRVMRPLGWSVSLRHLCQAEWRANRQCWQAALTHSRQTHPGTPRACPICYTGNSTDLVRSQGWNLQIPSGNINGSKN